ncbi:hypothetical protein AALG83_05900 [Christensenellaceae bacterium 44-20]
MGDRKEKALERLIYEHTTLFFADEDAPFIRSAAEAQRIIDSGKCASFATTLRRAMFLADMTDETKAMAQRLLRKAERKERRHSPKAVLRRKAIIASIVAALISFFTLVPQGRAIAKSVIDWAITFFDNGIVIVENRENKDPSIVSFGAEADSTPPPIESGVDVNTVDDTEHYYYNSIEEFVQERGKNPLILDNPEARLKTLHYNKDDEIGLSVLVSIYDYQGHEFTLIQDWSDTGSPVAYFFGENEIFYKDYQDKQIICCIDTRDDTANGVLILDDSQVIIGSENLPELWALFDQLRPYHS